MGQLWLFRPATLDLSTTFLIPHPNTRVRIVKKDNLKFKEKVAPVHGAILVSAEVHRGSPLRCAVPAAVPCLLHDAPCHVQFSVHHMAPL